METDSLGCGRKFKDFICGVADAWGYERLCPICKLKLKESWNSLKELTGGI